MIIQRVREILIETPAIFARVGTRIYPMTWPDAPEFPLIILQKISGLGEATNDGDAGIEGCRVQVDVHSDLGYDDAVQIARLVRRRLHAFKGGPASSPCAIDASFCINSADMQTPETEKAGPRLRSRMLEFRIWSTEG